MIAPIGSSFEVAFEGFKRFFMLKTGGRWEGRFCVAGGGGSRTSGGSGEAGVKGTKESNGTQMIVGEVQVERDLDTMQGWYRYRTPQTGPKGVMNAADLMVREDSDVGGVALPPTNGVVKTGEQDVGPYDGVAASSKKTDNVGMELKKYDGVERALIEALRARMNEQ